MPLWVYLWVWPLKASRYARSKGSFTISYWLFSSHFFGLSTKFGHSIPWPLDLDGHSMKWPLYFDLPKTLEGVKRLPCYDLQWCCRKWFVVLLFEHSCIIISCLSTHPFKYATCLSAQFFWQKIGFILFCLNMSCMVICRECMYFLWLKFNVSLLTFHWNVSNDHCSLLYIRATPVWTSKQSNWWSKILLCRASRPLKSVALLDSTNVSIGWNSLQYVPLIVPNFFGRLH